MHSLSYSENNICISSIACNHKSIIACNDSSTEGKYNSSIACNHRCSIACNHKSSCNICKVCSVWLVDLQNNFCKNKITLNSVGRCFFIIQSTLCYDIHLAQTY